MFGGEIIWNWLKNQNKVWITLLAFILTLCYQHFYNYIFGDKVEILYRIIDAPFRTIYSMLNAWIGIAFGYYAYDLLNNNILQSTKFKLFVGGLTLCAFAFITANYLPSFLNPFWSLFAPLFGPIGWLFLAKSMQKWKVMDFSTIGE